MNILKVDNLTQEADSHHYFIKRLIAATKFNCEKLYIINFSTQVFFFLLLLLPAVKGEAPLLLLTTMMLLFSYAANSLSYLNWVIKNISKTSATKDIYQ